MVAEKQQKRFLFMILIIKTIIGWIMLAIFLAMIWCRGKRDK